MRIIQTVRIFLNSILPHQHTATNEFSSCRTPLETPVPGCSLTSSARPVKPPLPSRDDFPWASILFSRIEKSLVGLNRGRSGWGDVAILCWAIYSITQNAVWLSALSWWTNTKNAFLQSCEDFYVKTALTVCLGGTNLFINNTMSIKWARSFTWVYSFLLSWAFEKRSVTFWALPLTLRVVFKHPRLVIGRYIIQKIGVLIHMIKKILANHFPIGLLLLWHTSSTNFVHTILVVKFSTTIWKNLSLMNAQWISNHSDTHPRITVQYIFHSRNIFVDLAGRRAPGEVVGLPLFPCILGTFCATEKHPI